MRPTDKTRNQALPRGQGDHSTLYVLLELSRSTWLVTSLSPSSDKMGTSKNIPLWCDDRRSRSQHGRSFNP